MIFEDPERAKQRVTRRGSVRIVIRKQGGRTSRLAAVAIGGLLVAGLIVALAIVLHGQAARSINGVGGVLWLASAGVLVVQLRREIGALRGFAIAAVLTLVLTALFPPSTAIPAIVGFGAGGAVMALWKGGRVAWAALLPALWLPMHLVIAVLRAVVSATFGSGAHLRSDPPPTAALVPLLMVVAALAGGWLVGGLATRLPRASSRPAR